MKWEEEQKLLLPNLLIVCVFNTWHLVDFEIASNVVQRKLYGIECNEPLSQVHSVCKLEGAP